MDTSEFTDFSTFNTAGVVVSDTFNTWRKKTNGIINAVNTNTLLPDGGITPAKLSTGKPSWDSYGNLTVTGTIGGGAITGTSLTASSGGAITGGAITGTSLNAGSGTITTTNTVYSNALAIGTGNNKFVVSSSGSLITANSITATSLNASGGQISGGQIIGTSLNVGSGTITGGTLTLSGGTGEILTNGAVKSNTLAIGTSNDKFTVSSAGVVTAAGNVTAPTFIGNLTGTASAIANSAVSPSKLSAGGPGWDANSTTFGGATPSGNYVLNIGNLARVSDGTCTILMGAMSGGGTGTTFLRESGLNSDFRLIQNGSGQISFEANGGLKIKDAPFPNPVGTAPLYGIRAYARFSATGTYETGYGLSCTKLGTGAYTVTLDDLSPGIPVVTATCHPGAGGYNWSATVQLNSNRNYTIRTGFEDIPSNGDCAFSIMVVY